MTIASPVTRLQFFTDGTSTVFPVNIQAYLATDFFVLLTNITTSVSVVWTLNNQYSLTSSGSLAPPDWTRTIPAALPAGSMIQAILNPTQTQQTQYVQNQAFPSLALQQNVDRLTQQVLRLQDQVNRTLRAPDGDITPGMQLVPAANRAMLYSAFDVNGNAIAVTNLPSGTGLTVNGLGAVLYPATAGEINALAPIVNPTIKPYNPLRYATNALPGITPMDTAFNYAAASILGTPTSPGSGGEMDIDMAGGPYSLTAGLNMTWAGTSNPPPITLRFLGTAVGAHPVAGCILNHSSIGIDCTGNLNLTIIDAFLTTPILPVPTNIPQVGILLARNTTRSSLVNRLVRPKVIGYYSVAGIYDYGSEGVVIDSPYINCFGAAGAGTCCLAFTAQNYANVSSIVPGLIATGSQSMTACTVRGGQFIMTTSATNTSDCIHLEGCADIWIRDNFVFNALGRSIVYADNSYAGTATPVPTARVTIDGMKTDPSGAPGSDVLFGPAAAAISHIGWKITNSYSNSINFALSCADANTSLNSLVIDQLNEQQSHGINIPGALTNFSRLMLGATVVNIGTVSQGCTILGFPPNITVGGVVGGVGLGNLISNNASQINGFGTPSGGVPVPNYNPATSTTTQDKQMIAIMAQALKLNGTFNT